MKITALKFDPKNANKGTPRGAKALAASLREFGAGRSILIDKNGMVIAGNKTLAQALARGDKDVTVVKTDGTKIVAVQRTDLDLRDAKAKGLAIADNRVGELDLEWDKEVLKELAKDVDLSSFWEPDELENVSFDASKAGEDDKALSHGFGVMIENITEKQQLELLDKLGKEGLTCRALTF